MTAVQLALDCEPTWEPEPDDDEDDGPWCRTDAPGLLPEQRDRTTTVTLIGDLL